MSETSPTSTERLPDTTNVLTGLSTNDGTLSLTVNFDKSVGKVAAWVVAVVMSCAALVGAGIVLAIWMIIAYGQAERETKLLREDMRVQAIALGRHGINVDEHAVEKGEEK